MSWSALAGCQADIETVDDEIIAAQDGDVHEQAASAETQAGLPEIHGVAGGVGYIKPQEALSQSCMPAGTLRESKVQPAFGCEKTYTEEEESRPDCASVSLRRVPAR